MSLGMNGFKRTSLFSMSSLLDDVPLWFKIVWVVSFLASIALVAGVIYVVVHFVGKFW